METKDRIARLLHYKNLLLQLQSIGLVKVFSDNIADALGVSSSLVRKDFGIFGIAGSQKGGYTIEETLGKINNILGKNEIQKIIIVGVGRIGGALIEYKKGFQKEGIKIVAGFDSDPARLDNDIDIPIYSIEDLPGYVKENNIRFAILAVPEVSAQQTIEFLRESKIQGILNFTSLKVKSSDDLAISNINIEHELARLIYFVNNKQ